MGNPSCGYRRPQYVNKSTLIDVLVVFFVLIFSLTHMPQLASVCNSRFEADPGTFTELVLDPTFDPSSQSAQVYLKEFCERIFDEDFAGIPDEEFSCPLSDFDFWLLRFLAMLGKRQNKGSKQQRFGLGRWLCS